MKNNYLKILALNSVFLLLCQNCSNDEIIKESILENTLAQNFEDDPELAYPESVGELIEINPNSEESFSLEKIEDEYIFSGDIILSKEQFNTIINENLKTKGDQKRTGLSSLAKRWPNCTVYYRIHPDLPDKSRVREAIAHWESQYSINFVRRESQKNFIQFFPASGCSSYLGMIGGKQRIFVSPKCTTGSIIHEIGHALGFFHEQQRTDRNKSIKIRYKNIKKGKEHNFETYKQRGIKGYQIGDFDFNSIMMYGSYAFSKNGKPTITKVDGSLYSIQRRGLSVGDLEMIEDMYGCNAKQ